MWRNNSQIFPLVAGSLLTERVGDITTFRDLAFPTICIFPWFPSWILIPLISHYLVPCVERVEWCASFANDYIQKILHGPDAGAYAEQVEISKSSLTQFCTTKLHSYAGWLGKKISAWGHQRDVLHAVNTDLGLILLGVTHKLWWISLWHKLTNQWNGLPLQKQISFIPSLPPPAPLCRNDHNSNSWPLLALHAINTS